MLHHHHDRPQLLLAPQQIQVVAAVVQAVAQSPLWVVPVVIVA